jgi:hypothetical protein
MITAVESALSRGNSEELQDAIYALGKLRDPDGTIPDEVANHVLSILRRPEIWNSALAGHILNFFEFEAPHISQAAKDRCRAFLREWGQEFTDFHSVQVVGELLHGPYLQAVEPKPQRKKPRWSAERKRGK